MVAIICLSDVYVFKYCAVPCIFITFKTRNEQPCTVFGHFKKLMAVSQRQLIYS